MIRIVANDLGAPSALAIQKTTLYARILLDWSHFGEALRCNNPVLFATLQNAAHLLQSTRTNRSRKQKPFLYATQLETRTLQLAIDLYTDRAGNIADRLYKACGGIDRCTRTTRIGIDRLARFVSALDRHCAVCPLGFFYSETDGCCLPFVASISNAGRVGTLDEALQKAAHSDNVIFRRSQAAARSNVPLDQQRQDAMLVSLVLDCKPELKRHIRAVVQASDQCSQRQFGRLMIVKQTGNDTVAAFWQPLTREVKQSLRKSAARDSNDKTLQWIQEQRSDRFVATIFDNCAPNSHYRTVVLHALMLRDADDQSSAMPNLNRFEEQ